MEENRKVRNVLVTSIMRDVHEDEVKYFYYNYNGIHKFGSRVVRSEAAACMVLSETKLDEIIAVGRNTDINENDILEKQVISNMSDLPADTSKMSDYCFFKYRLCEYINGLDIEASDIYEKVPKARKEEIASTIRYILGDDISRGFRQVHNEFDLLNKIYEKAGITAKEEKELVKNFLFVNMRKEDKILPKIENKGIEISYLPVIMTDNNSEAIANGAKLVELLGLNRNDELNLFVDLQGFSLADGYTFFNLMNLLDIDSKYNLTIKAVTSLTGNKNAIAEKLSDASSRYKSSELLSGIEAFINYGQTKIITEYWKKTGIKNDYVSEFLYAMSMVDTGISLCNNDELIAGIKKIIACMNDDSRAGKVDLSNEEAMFIMQIRHAVANDYADLIDKNGELDLSQLIKWEYKKGHYQQAMTIIESKTPQILLEHGALYYARNDEDKNKVLAFLNNRYWRENSRLRWSFNDVSHWVIKYMPRNPAIDKHQMKTPLDELMAGVLVDSFQDDSTCGIQLFTEATDMDALKALLQSYYAMGTLRNSVCHAGKDLGSEDEVPDYNQVNPIWKCVSDGIRTFINKMDKLLENVEGKTFTSVEISKEEFTAYAEAHKFYPDEDTSGDRNQNGPRYNKPRYNGPRYNKPRYNGPRYVEHGAQRHSDNNSGRRPYEVKVGRDNNSVHVYIDLAISAQDLAVSPEKQEEKTNITVKTDRSYEGIGEVNQNCLNPSNTEKSEASKGKFNISRIFKK